MENWWVNGQPGRLIDVTDRGLAYGDGLFETIAIRAGQPRFLGLHLDRLLAGCSRLRIAAPGRTSLESNLAAAAGGVRHGVLKVIVTRGPGPRGYGLPADPVTTVVWGAADSPVQASLPIEIRWCETMASVNPATAGCKSLARLDQILARAEWAQPEVAEGLMTTTDGHLIGGTASNVFLVTGARILTPAVHRAGIAGVMRRMVLTTAKDAGISIVEGQLAPSEVGNAAEVFVTNALTGIRPVRRLGARTWLTGPLTRQLQQLLAAAGVTECAGHC